MTESFECVPPYTCFFFACPYDDCKREDDATQEEMSFRRTSRRRSYYDIAVKNMQKAKRASMKKRKEARDAAKKVGKRKGGK